MSDTAVTESDFDTRTRLLEAAGPVFASSGYDRATVREICAAADSVNIASVGYYFGDKMGLYREVIRGIRDSRERRFPTPQSELSDPTEVLRAIVRTLLSRILADDPTGWESQLMMREMQNPTPVFDELIREFFQPLFQRLKRSLHDLTTEAVDEHVIDQLALSVVGQCVYHKFGAKVIEIMIPATERKKHFGIETLVEHISAVTLSALAHTKSHGVVAPPQL
ncbi:CerR family C-terminal domain-containing protein [Rubripirellula amarantea]|nr:CerR family C-terminal domain-containing protein [Rubripirellula amarantea]